MLDRMRGAANANGAGIEFSIRTCRMFKRLAALLISGMAMAGGALAQPAMVCQIDSNFTGVFDGEPGNYTLIVIPGASATLRANCSASVNSYNWDPGRIQTSSIAVTAPGTPGDSAPFTLTGCNSSSRTCGAPVTMTIQAASASAPDCLLTASPNPAPSGQSVTFSATCNATRPPPARINYVDLSGTIRSSTALTFTDTAPVVTSQTTRNVFYEAVSNGNLAGPQRVLQVTIEPVSNKTQADVGVVFSTRPPASVNVGDIVTFAVRLNNNGPEPARGVTFDGFVDSQFDNVATTSTLCTASADHVHCDFDSIDPGPPGTTSGVSVRLFNFTARARQSGTALTRIFESVDINRTNDPNSTNSGDSATTTVIAPKLQLIGLEVTQVVQDLVNSVPLVEAKPTVVRAHIKNLGTGNPLVDGQLIGNRIAANGSRTALGTLSPSNTGKAIKALRNPSRASLDDSFYFELPDAWRTGTVELEFRGIDATLTCSEPDGTPDCKVSVIFNPVAAFSMKFIALTYNDAKGIGHTPTLSDVFTVANEFLAHYPINNFDGDLGVATTEFDACSGFKVTAGMRKELNALRNTECKSGSCKQFYQGLLADRSSCSPATDANGEGDLPGNASVVFFPTNRIGTRAHEQGHVMGFKHVDYTGDGTAGDEGCGDATGKAIPCSRLEGDGTLSGTKDQYGPNTAYGFDANNLSPQRIYAAETSDFMSYGNPRWPSRANYIQLFNKFKVSGSSDAKALTDNKVKAVSATQTVLIDGSVLLDGSGGTIESVYVSSTPGTVTLPAAGDYAIRLDNAQGTQLASYSFVPVAGSESPTVGNFSLQLPWDAAAKRIVLLRNGQLLASRQASANPPTIRVTFPNGGESLNGASATFTWTASDPDGDALTYAVDYSTDNGATWRALTINWNATSFPVDLTRLPGGNQALIRVTASDGFNSAQDQSDAVFSVPLRAPGAFIATPEDNHLYVGDQTIILKGLALDMKEGLLDTSRLTWSSSLNSALGSGNSLSLNALDLQEGIHTISLTARNSTALAGVATVAIKVLRTRPTLPATLAVGPTGLAFTATFGSTPPGSQQVAIRNSGDGELNWSASADQSWLQLDAQSAAAPADLSITANPAGLAAGQYTANVTITSAGAANSPQIVNVMLTVAAAPVVAATVVEYLDTADFPNSPGGHFFYSSDPAEQAAVDAGAAGAFSRTGRQFLTGGSSPVCRFYGSVTPGPNSHFFTVDVAECNALKAAQVSPTPATAQQWNYEGISYNTTPVSVAANGSRSCPAGTQPLYRAYNNAYPLSGPKNSWDSNHRFTPALGDIAAMVTRGWRDEGIVFCTAQ